MGRISQDQQMADMPKNSQAYDNILLAATAKTSPSSYNIHKLQLSQGRGSLTLLHPRSEQTGRPNVCLLFVPCTIRSLREQERTY